MIKEIENGIINALTAAAQVEGSALKDLDIERCPEDFDVNSMKSAIGAVWIHYSGTDSSDMSGAGGGIQDDIFYFDVNVLVRNLRPGVHAQITDSGNAYEVIPAIRNRLTGMKPADGFKPMYMKKSELVSVTSGIWQYAMRFATKGRYYYEEEEQPAVNSKKITFQGANRTIIVEKEEAENG